MMLERSRSLDRLRVDGQEISDPVFGRYRIEEPVLLELLETDVVRRLAEVHQAGASYLVRPGRDIMRFEHSVGVMLLIRQLGGDVAAQVAGLLHDVSHTAFSHVVDRVYRRKDEDYHEHLVHDWVAASSLPVVLARHGLTLDQVLDTKRWPLLDRPFPDLSADRIDYTLRDLLRLGGITQREVISFVQSLVIHEETIAVAMLSSAVWFLRQYHREVVGLFMDPVELAANASLAESIETALEVGVIEEADLMLSDEGLLARLRSCGIREVTVPLQRLQPMLHVAVDDETYDYQLVLKDRFVDPLVLSDGGAARCSDLDPALRDLRDDISRRAEKGIGVRIIG
jgi:uncharacterized protein